MTPADMKEQLDISDEDLNKHLFSLEKQGLAGLYRDKEESPLPGPPIRDSPRRIPPEYYRYIPDWADPQDIF